MLLAALVHVLAGWLADEAFPGFGRPGGRPVPVTLLVMQPDETVEEAPPEEEPELDGQLVDVAPPEVEQRPEEADYLAEHDRTVEEETRTEEYEINPEVLAHEHSEEQQTERNDIEDLDVTDPSTGARTGNERFDPARDGRLASLPSPWTATNKEGFEAPVPADQGDRSRQGAPNNDLLDEEVGDAVALNTKELLYAEYLNRIRRLVNFYWEQNIDNLPGSVRLAKPRYTTGVDVVLDGDGALERLEVTRASGSGELDHAVAEAFRVAGPFPNPPEGLIEPDGRVYLPAMRFTVNVGVAENRYQGVDPRAGVQFPGLLKSPR